jgi:allophanate hydrolase subunit 1
MIDLSRPDPFLLSPGDLVRFYRIDEAAFEEGLLRPEVAA